MPYLIVCSIILSLESISLSKLFFIYSNGTSYYINYDSFYNIIFPNLLTISSWYTGNLLYKVTCYYSLYNILS